MQSNWLAVLAAVVPAFGPLSKHACRPIPGLWH